MDSSNSSLTSDDEDEITEHHSSFLQHSIPRTNFHSFEHDEQEDLEEDYHEAFPISRFVSNFFSDFSQRKNSDPDPFHRQQIQKLRAFLFISSILQFYQISQTKRVIFIHGMI